ncbi:hypothetical protein [Bacillus pumilus]|uniref:hypothetical protein n=1 Tax=Bacillus pumilus TaxID=1408 RepID=UPI003391B527
MDTNKFKTFTSGKAAYQNSIRFYEEFQRNDPDKFNELIIRLQNQTEGSMVPLPCSEDPNEQCGWPSPISLPTQSPKYSTVADILKMCGDNRYMIFFSRPPGAQSYSFYLFWVASFVITGGGNINKIFVALDSADDPTEFYYDLFIRRFSIRTIQC